jgi:hypothetical protein
MYKKGNLRYYALPRRGRDFPFDPSSFDPSSFDPSSFDPIIIIYFFYI